MVMKMNKQGFIDELVKQTGYEKDKCIIISNSLEDNFLFGKKNKCKTITASMENLMKVMSPNEEEITEIPLDWKDIYGELKKGTYRIIKNKNFMTLYSEPFNIE